MTLKSWPDRGSSIAAHLMSYLPKVESVEATAELIDSGLQPGVRSPFPSRKIARGNVNQVLRVLLFAI